jgi:hypothetical protein
MLGELHFLEETIARLTERADRIREALPGSRYAEAMNFRFTETRNGNLRQVDLDEMTEEWHQWIRDNQPQLSSDIVLGPNERIFQVKCGGLKVISKSPAHQEYNRIVDQSKIKAANIAEEKRRNADPPWTGPDHLTDPQGKTHGRSHQKYGPFTTP